MSSKIKTTTTHTYMATDTFEVGVCYDDAEPFRFEMTHDGGVETMSALRVRKLVEALTTMLDREKVESPMTANMKTD
jgi:hypothetical protein